MIKNEENENSTVQRLSPKRQRKLFFLRIHETWKTWAWRITALWCWAHLLDWLVLKNALLGTVEKHAFAATFKWLSRIGFHPSSEHAFEFVLKALWLATICTFSIGLFGFFALYVAFWPLLVPFIVKSRKILSKSREKGLRKIVSQPVLRPVPILTSGLIAWFILYDGTRSPGPLLISVLLSGALLIVVATRTFTYATSIEARVETKIHLIFRALSQSVIETLRGIKPAGAPLKQQLKFSRGATKFFLWCARKASILTYGRAGRSRAYLFVLAVYLLTLSLLGILTALFWAFVIRYSLAPAYVPMREAILAASTHIIPGIDNLTGLRISPNLQVLASASAWLLLVLFAGPAASNYPALQDKFVQEMRSANASIRLDRRRLYWWTVVCDSATEIINEHPELDPLCKIILILLSANKFGGLEKWQPDFAKALADNPAVTSSLIKALNPINEQLAAPLARYTSNQDPSSPCPLDLAPQESPGPVGSGPPPNQA